MNVFAWILLFLLGRKVDADVVYWVIWSLGVGWWIFRQMIESAPEMEDG